MKIITFVLVLVALGAVFLFCVAKIMRAICNLVALKKYGKAIDGAYHVESSGIVFNKKTKKLEGTSSKVITPFN